jgi:hypothetical protein
VEGYVVGEGKGMAGDYNVQAQETGVPDQGCMLRGCRVLCCSHALCVSLMVHTRIGVLRRMLGI